MKLASKHIPAVFAVAVCLCGPTVGAPSVEIVRPSGFAITPMTGWKVSPPSTMGADVFVFTAPVSKFTPNLNVVVTTAEPDDTLAGMPQQVRATYPSLYKNFRLLSDSYISQGSLVYYRDSARYTAGTPSITMRMNQLMVIRDGKCFTITMTAPYDRFSAYAPSFNAMIASFHFVDDTDGG